MVKLSIVLLLACLLPTNTEEQLSSNQTSSRSLLLEVSDGDDSAVTYVKTSSSSSLQSRSSIPQPTTTTATTTSSSWKSPNIIFIITDEHNFRTLGCYRDYLRTKHLKREVHVWGKENIVETPHLDKLAQKGAIFTNFYTVAPKCTPSRASFLSGLYPKYTEAYNNHAPMDTSITTWMEVLQQQKGYYTSFIGKWHLDGDAKPGWYSSNSQEIQRQRSFGFNETKYRYNRGHWKYFEDIINVKNGKEEVKEYTITKENNFKSTTHKHYGTDFLMQKGIDFIKVAKQRQVQYPNQNLPFAVMMSIPDPHHPNQNRFKYRKMYNDYKFNMPRTAFTAIQSDPATPIWNSWAWKDIDNLSYDGGSKYLRKVRNSETFQDKMRQYFGMVKCIDDNIGKLMKHLEATGLDQNTMIVFTSDHGDMLFEHGEVDKGSPYQASAGIPFLIHYPNVVPPNKIIETAYSSIDTFPTLLSLAGIDLKDVDVPYQGVDASSELLSTIDTERDETKIIFLQDVTKTKGQHRWLAASTNQYKFVVSQGAEKPFLFDLERDPYEIINYIDSLEHEFIKQQLQLALVDGMKKYDMTIGNGWQAILVDSPTCIDSQDTFTLWNDDQKFRCKDLETEPIWIRCLNNRISTNCPRTCNKCPCENSPGLILVDQELTTCGPHLLSKCPSDANLRLFCPKLCSSVQVGPTKVCRS